MIAAGGLGHNLYLLFSEMSIVTVILAVVGLALIIIEFFQPAYNIPTYCGSALVMCAIAVRMLSGGTFIMLFYMVFTVALVLFTAHIIMLITQKRAWLSTSLAFKLKQAVDASQQSGYAYLLGLEGVAATDIYKSGKMSLDSSEFDVTSDEDIKKGTAVKVVHVVGDSIKVIPCDNSDD